MKTVSEISAREAAGIRALILDVDGVLTDGGIVLSSAGEEVKQFCAKDGAGIKYWHRAGHVSAILSGRHNDACESILARRAEELGMARVVTGAKDKLPALEKLLAELGLAAAECAYVGDDLPDLPPMRAVGLGVAVADAVEEVKDGADFVTVSPGGRGAVREVVTAVLRAQGQWARILERYLPPAAKGTE